MFSVFTWLRTAAKNAVLGGVADAVAELDEPSSDAGQRLAAVRLKLAGAELPALAGDGETEREPAAARKRKAVANG